MKEKRLLIKNITSLGVVQIVNYAFPLITIPFVSRILGPSSLGTINYINAFIVYFTVLVGYGFNYSATRKISANYNDIKNRDLVFSEVISENKPSVSLTEIRKYEALKKQWDNEKQDLQTKNERPRIGFRPTNNE